MNKPQADWKWNGKYPVRCQIVDPAGHVLKSKTVRNKKPIIAAVTAKCPDVARPHVSKIGKATLLKNGDVKIKLDDGSVLYGYECWWVALPPV